MKGAPPVDGDLTCRSRGEELWLWRKGLGLSQEAASARLGVPRGYLAKVERGAATGALWWPRKAAAPSLTLLLRLARRRSGLSVAEVTEARGTTRMALNKAERRGFPALVEFWESRGFTFGPKGGKG